MRMLPSRLAPICLALAALGPALRGDFLPNPAITGSSTPYSAAYAAANLFDSTAANTGSNGFGFISRFPAVSARRYCRLEALGP